MIDELRRAMRAFDAEAFTARHGGHKESRNPHSCEYLLHCLCGSDRLRWRHEPGVKQAWKCWGCSRSGGTIDLVMLLERVDRFTAIGIILDGYNGGDAPTELREDLRIRPAARTELIRLPAIHPPRGFELISPPPHPHRQAIDYLIGERGLSWGDIQRWRIGFARVGRLKGYVVFPVFMDGGLVYWQARATWDPPRHLNRDQRRAWEKATGYRKTLNPLNREQAAAASEVLLNYDVARVAPHVVVVEGPIDAIKVGPHAVALLGKVATEAKIERLLRMFAQRYTVYMDPGEEERQKAEQLAEQLSDFAPTFIADPPEGYDPGALTPAQNAAVIARAPAFKVRGLVSDLRAR
jgi:DNA primase